MPDTPSAPSGEAVVAQTLRYAAREGWGAETLVAELQASGAGAVAELFAESRPALADPSACVRLLDLDWSFGVSASSSEHMAMGTTFVQLRMLTQTAGGAAEHVHVELSLERFYELLHALQAARARMELC